MQLPLFAINCNAWIESHCEWCSRSSVSACKRILLQPSCSADGVTQCSRRFVIVQPIVVVASLKQYGSCSLPAVLLSISSLSQLESRQECCQAQWRCVSSQLSSRQYHACASCGLPAVCGQAAVVQHGVIGTCVSTSAAAMLLVAIFFASWPVCSHPLRRFGARSYRFKHACPYKVLGLETFCSKPGLCKRCAVGMLPFERMHGVISCARYLLYSDVWLGVRALPQLYECADVKPRILRLGSRSLYLCCQSSTVGGNGSVNVQAEGMTVSMCGQHGNNIWEFARYL